MENLKGLHCEILESKGIGNCSNGGISEKVKEVTLVGIGCHVFDADENAPAVKLVQKIIGGKEYFHAEPVEPCPAGKIGYMFGGTFIHTSDSRFPFDYPLKLHDRSETQEQYDRLSA